MKNIISIAAALILGAASVFATDNYEYGPDEYVTISNGISPDHKLAITAHGTGEMGDENFHLYLFDAAAEKKIGPLDEIDEVLDTGAGSFAAKWAKDSAQATIVYRVDRHAPLKSITYRFTKGHAVSTTKKPVDVKDAALIKFWQDHCSDSKPSEKTFGTPKQH